MPQGRPGTGGTSQTFTSEGATTEDWTGNSRPGTAPPSIPGRWTTKIKHKSKRSRAFGSTASRFDNSHITALPGPGTYHNERDASLLKFGPSFSKKGFGNAFISKKPKLVDLYKDTSGVPGGNPAPGQYYQPPKPAGIEIAFTTCKDGRVPFEVPKVTTPGPYDYQVKDPDMSPLLRNKPSASMCSKSGRDSFFSIMSDAPRVGKYTLPDAFADQEKRTDYPWSKSYFRRFQDIGVDNKVPPPTRYFADMEEEPRQTLRSAGSYRGKYLGKQNSRVSTTHTFGADTDRFKHSFCGRLDIAATMPGPGAYTPVLPDPVISDGGIFRSRSPNRAEFARRGVPGPLYYKPISTIGKSTAQCQVN